MHINTQTPTQSSSNATTEHSAQSNSNISNKGSTEDSDNLFPSGKLLLDTIRHEYDIESSRKRDIEVRTGMLITLLGALIGFYATTLDFSIFKLASSPLEFIGIVALALLYLLPTFLLLKALSILLEILNTKSYERLGLNGFNENSAKKPDDYVASKLVESYKAVIENNDAVNEEKAKQLKRGIRLIYISLISVIIVYSVKEIISLIL